MAAGSDAVTRGWRGVSLRAKVTGVTVAILAIGLAVAGIGTAFFLSNSLINGIDDSLRPLANANLAPSLITVENTANGPKFTARPDVPTDFFVALYDETGKLRITAGGNGAPSPVFPETYKLSQTQIYSLQAFPLENSSGGPDYRAMVALQNVVDSRTLYTQLVALPTAPVVKVVTAYLGIYTLLALVILIAGALATRWLVTLTFRSLGQVEAAADSIAAGDFSQRLTDIEPPTTEVGRLKNAMNAMLVHVDDSISQRDASVRQMRRFIGDASHELRTPLVTVRGYAELYRIGAIEGDEATAQAMERIEKEAIRMGVLVEDLLALARLDEKRDVVIEQVDLRPIARDAAMDVHATSPGREVTVIDTTDMGAAESAAAEADLTTNAVAAPARGARGRAGATLSRLRRRGRPTPLAPEIVAPPAALPEPLVLADENQVRQVVANLLGNARRYSPDESPLELRVGVDTVACMGWIEVVDHGDGIPEQIREQIFQRFWRADTSRTRETGGSGLGLSIVASIVETLHGTVSVDDTPGGGATFRVALPLAEERNAADHVNLETQPLTRIAVDED
ncbi:sensor histidine kinase [Microbacterium sp. ASV49]|uniref:histidine kinase n=1 Tax=Microbacterium candidum TaxID=3041922 RepID=A0ABT7N313_9MICO|nr:HAMP domain-containing sensor histidine kinase [Microbacterium sp. ASV49]MDL9981098.1 HAMP domain-containing sensor histidine kinase [Microbacterium sp. ASV49]